MDQSEAPAVAAPKELLPGGWYEPLDATAAFDAAPDQTLYLAVVATVEGTPGARLRIGLAFDGATTHQPSEGFEVAVTVDESGRATAEAAVYVHPWTSPAEAPRHWPEDARAAWVPEPCPRGHVLAGPHVVALWGRAEGGPVRVVGAVVVVADGPPA